MTQYTQGYETAQAAQDYPEARAAIAAEQKAVAAAQLGGANSQPQSGGLAGKITGGWCPHCGRGGSQYPSYPYYPQITYTCGGTAGAQAQYVNHYN